ncbi:MAG: hypothetical protein V4495_05910 [Pseudomonadota bacterium]
MIKTDCRFSTHFHAMQHAILKIKIDQKNNAGNGVAFVIALRVRPDKAFNFPHLEMQETNS